MFRKRTDLTETARQRRRERNRGRELQGGGGVVDDVGAEGEEGAVEEVEHRHLAAVVVSGVWAAARARRPVETVPARRRLGETRSGVIGLESDQVETRELAK